MLDIIVDGVSFEVGQASGVGCNCLIDTLRQAMGAGVVCNVASVRWTLERRHAELFIRIVSGDYLDLDSWADIVNFIGSLQEHRPSTRPRASHFRVVCVC